MRNTDFLDNEIPEDNLIGELKSDENGNFRMVNGRKIYQIDEKTQQDKDLQLTINRVRASGLNPSEYLKQLYQ